MAITKEQISALYIAAFGRAPDGNGLTYWENDAATNNYTLETLADVMYQAAVQNGEAPTDVTALVTAVYQNVLGKTPTQAELDYWVNDIQDPNTATNEGTLIAAIYNAATIANPDDPGTKALLNKAAAGVDIAAKLPSADVDGDGVNDLTVFKDLVANVTDDPTTVTSAVSGADAYVPKSLALTTGTDALVGSKVNDTFTGVVSSLSSEATLNTKDQIDGGDGTDTLNLDLKGTFSGLGTDGFIKNIENINLTNNTVIDRSFDAKNVTGVEKYTLDSAKSISLSNLAAAGIEVEIKGAQNDSTIAFDSNLDLSGSTDAMSLTLDGVGAAKVLNADGTVQTPENDVKITMASIEEVTVNTVNNASFLDASGMDATTLTVKGDQALTVSAVKDGLTTFDASAATGAVTVNLTGVTTADSIKTINTGSGDDSITIDAADVVANASIAGGTGADTLTLEDTANSTVQFAMSGVETLALSNITATTFSAKNVLDLSTIQINDATDGKTAATAATSVVNLGGADITVNSIGATNGGADLTLDNSGTVTVNMQASSANSAAKGTGVALADAEAMAADINAQNASNVTINVEKGIDAQGTVTAAKATAVTLNVDTLLNKATTPTEQTGFTGEIVAGKATDLTIDAKGQVAITNASDLSAVQTATITAGDSLSFGTEDLSSAASVVLSGENKESTITLNNIGTDGTTAVDYDVNVIASGLKAGLTIGGIASQQNLKVNVNDTTGNVSMDALVGANVTLDASTLAGNLNGTTTAGVFTAGAYTTVSSLNIQSTVAAGATAASGTATINVHDNAGTVALGNIGGTLAAGGTFKTVTVDASSNTKSVGIGTIIASDSVTVKFNDNLDTSTVGAIAAKDVTIDASNALKAVTIGATAAGAADITVTDSLTYTAGLVGANDATGAGAPVDVAIDTAATDTTITLNGNIGDDQFKIVTGDYGANAKITVTGDLDIGTDSVEVDASAENTGTENLTIDLSGLKGSDTTTITGGAGDDTIKAATTATTITGGAGADIITLGAGADTVVVSNGDAGTSGNETITSYDTSATGDTLDLDAATAINTDVAAAPVDVNGGGVNDYNISITNGVITYTALAGADFTVGSVADLITLAQSVMTADKTVAVEYNGNTYVLADQDGSTTVNVTDVIELIGVTGVTAMVTGAGNNADDAIFIA